MFSRATIMDSMYLLSDIKSHSKLDSYIFRYGLESSVKNGSKIEKVSSLGKALLRNPNSKGILGDNLQFEIIEDIIIKAVRDKTKFDSQNNEFINYPQLRRLLLKDGFVVSSGGLKRVFAGQIDFNSNEILLEELLKKHNFEDSYGHYQQAGNAFTRGDWAACNSQLRTYVEALLNNIAEEVTGEPLNGSHEARVALSNSNPPIFYRELNEWLDNGKGFFQTFWNRLHTHGSHPGLSDESDSVFRFNLVQIATMEILRRFDKDYSE